MNLSAFGLSSSPFTPVSGRGFVSVPARLEPLEELLDALQSGRGIAVLSGAPGSGKSALCDELEARLQGRFHVSRLTDATCATRRALLQSLLFSLGLTYVGLTEQESRLSLLDFLTKNTERPAGLIVIAEEAGRLNDRLLEELRSLTSHQRIGLPLVRLLLCGDMTLEERLTNSELASIQQRIVCHQVLSPLTQAEAARVIDERIQGAGGDGWEHVFDREAMELLCLACDGSPRNLLELSDRSLKLAARRRENPVGIEAVRAALDQLRDLPMQWHEPASLEVESYSADDEPAFDSLESDESPSAAGSVAEVEPHPVAAAQTGAAAVIEVGAGISAHGKQGPAAAIEPASSAPISEQPELDALFLRTTNEAPAVADPAVAAPASVFEFGAEPPRAEVPSRGELAGKGPSPAWTEFEVDDPYVRLAVSQPLPATPVTPVRAVHEVARESVTDMVNTSPPQFESELEDELIEQVLSLRALVSNANDRGGTSGRESTSTGAAPLTTPEESHSPDEAASQFQTGSIGRLAALPEWDVIQPEWLCAREGFVPVEIGPPSLLRAEIEAASRAFVTAEKPARTAETTASAPALVAEHEVPAGPVAEADDTPMLDNVATGRGTARRSSEAAPDPAGPAGENRSQRPFLKLFSRLRRRQAAAELRYGATPE